MKKRAQKPVVPVQANINEVVRIHLGARYIGGFKETAYNGGEGRLEVRALPNRLVEFEVEVDIEVLTHLLTRAAHSPSREARLGNGAIKIRAVG